MQENAQLCAKKRGNGQEDHFGAPKSALIGVEGDVVGCMVVCHGTSPSKVESKVHYFSVGGGYGGQVEMRGQGMMKVGGKERWG